MSKKCCFGVWDYFPRGRILKLWKKHSLLIMMHVDAVLVYFGQGSAYWSIMHPF